MMRYNKELVDDLRRRSVLAGERPGFVSVSACRHSSKVSSEAALERQLKRFHAFGGE